jgi:putative ABC transport system substrate-binding protein
MLFHPDYVREKIRAGQLINRLAVYTVREFPEAGGLMSYGTSLTEVFRQIGLYAGRILKGAKPTDVASVAS